MWISIYEAEPKEVGWYPILICWDEEEGHFPGAAYWTGKEWSDNVGPISFFLDEKFTEQDDAYDVASENDPEW